MVNELINAPGVYLILGVQTTALNRWEAFIFVTVINSAKVMSCLRKCQENLKKQNIQPINIRQASSMIHITLLNPNIDVRILGHCYCVAIVSLYLL